MFLRSIALIVLSLGLCIGVFLLVTLSGMMPGWDLATIAITITFICLLVIGNIIRKFKYSLDAIKFATDLSESKLSSRQMSTVTEAIDYLFEVENKRTSKRWQKFCVALCMVFTGLTMIALSILPLLLTLPNQ